VILPLQAGFGTENWLFGFVIAMFLVLVGVLALYFASPRLNLSRAAQESRHRGAYQRVSLLGDSHLTRQMKTRARLGVQHAPSRIPGRAGAWSLLWKDGVSSGREISLGHVVAWLGVFGISLGMVIAPDWGTRIWALIIWCWLIGQRGTQRLRSDLEQWVISRQMPFSGRATMAVECALPVFITLLLTWFAIPLGYLLGFSPQIIFIFLAPAQIINIVLAATYDILRKSRGSDLLAGQVAEPGAIGLLLGAFLAGIPLLVLTWLTYQTNLPGVNVGFALFGFAFSMGVSYLMWKLVASAYLGIK
jgi:hypothetical protein